jgi:hypothetical protein
MGSWCQLLLLKTFAFINVLTKLTSTCPLSNIGQEPILIVEICKV